MPCARYDRHEPGGWPYGWLESHPVGAQHTMQAHGQAGGARAADEGKRLREEGGGGMEGADGMH